MITNRISIHYFGFGSKSNRNPSEFEITYLRKSFHDFKFEKKLFSQKREFVISVLCSVKCTPFSTLTCGN